MIFTTFLQTWWRQIAVIAVGVIIFTWGYHLGYSHEKAVYDAYRYQSEALAHIAEAHTADVSKKQVEITNNVTKGYANAIDKLKAYYANHRPVKWLHDTIPSSGEVSDLSDTSKGANGDTKSNQSSADGVTPLDCASDVLQLLSLQKWIKEQEGNK